MNARKNRRTEKRRELLLTPRCELLRAVPMRSSAGHEQRQIIVLLTCREPLNVRHDRFDQRDFTPRPANSASGSSTEFGRVLIIRPLGPGRRMRRVSEKPASRNQSAYSGSL